VNTTGQGRAALVLLAAGDGRRSGHHTNKVLLPLAGRRVLTWSIRWATILPSIVRVVVVIREQDRTEVEAVLDREAPDVDVRLVVGGATRHGSEWEALQVLAPDIERGEVDVVLIHDAARPLASTDLFARVIATASAEGGAIPVREHGNLVGLDGSPGPSDRVVAVQTPQGFAAARVLTAYRQAAEDGFVGTDTASCVERYTDVPVCGVDGDVGNIKITFPEDLFLAERLLAKADWDLSRGAAS
jgi:2-C-methyl-D-erythritol 4-phosphate cytidylyltransferase